MFFALIVTTIAAVAAAHGSPQHHEHRDASTKGLSNGAAALRDPAVMNLVLMTDKMAQGAVCLDGTAAGFYYAPAQNSDNQNNWQIYFQGGGWCYNEVDCLARSNTDLGSSTHWANTSSISGIMSSDCTANPDFCNFNRVHIGYCDGNSFSGNRDEPVVVNGKPLYFRGRRIIDAVLQTLTSKYSLANAEQVLLTGCSAGGLATYLHTNYVGDQLQLIAPSMIKFKSVPISGFFLMHNNVVGVPVYPTEMKYIFNLANSTSGMASDCVNHYGPTDDWKCNFAQVTYPFIGYPIFPLNSQLDSWQTGCIYTSVLPPNFPNQTGTENGMCGDVPGWASCSSRLQCNSTQSAMMTQYSKDFMTAISAGAPFKAAGNGAFLDTEHSHCAGQGVGWQGYSIGGTKMQQAVSKWWNGDGTDPAAQNTHVCDPWPAPCK